jgi:hypothetical protein
MSLRRRFLAIASLVSMIAVSAAAAGGDRDAFKVTSTLDGKRVLPLRMRWLAYPKLPASKISRVDFLIDGKVRWIERHPPYNYGSDDFHGHLGFLITTWLRPRRHTFTARAVDRRGRKATDTVVARVLPAPEPPASLAGIWTRLVTPADLKKGDNDGPPAGRWKLVFDRVGAWHLDPLGSGLVNQYGVAGTIINVYAPIQMAPFSDGKGGISRFGARGIGGTDCREDGPFGSYTWSVSENELTLTAKKEGCGNRRAIWEGIWTRLR